jgi:hypothetical protein
MFDIVNGDGTALVQWDETQLRCVELDVDMHGKLSVEVMPVKFLGVEHHYTVVMAVSCINSARGKVPKWEVMKVGRGRFDWVPGLNDSTRCFLHHMETADLVEQWVKRRRRHAEAMVAEAEQRLHLAHPRYVNWTFSEPTRKEPTPAQLRSWTDSPHTKTCDATTKES